MYMYMYIHISLCVYVYECIYGSQYHVEVYFRYMILILATLRMRDHNCKNSVAIEALMIIWTLTLFLLPRAGLEV